MPYYVIRVVGHLSDGLLTAFPSLAASNQPVQTVLYGSLADQGALTGVLNHLDEMGVEMLEITQVPGADPTPLLGRETQSQGG